MGIEEVELDAALRQRRRPIQRLLGVALVGVLLLVTISGVIVTVNPGVPAALGEMLHGTPTPTATIGPGGDIAYYAHGAPWGTLTIDGRTVPISATPKPDVLARGRHTLTYRADPFPALRCSITTPAAASDTCPLAKFASLFGEPMNADTRVVDLGSTIDRLPAAQRDALIALVRSQVEYTSPVTTVRPGEHYGGVSGGHTTLETATQPLNATLQIRLKSANAQTNSAPGSPSMPDCASVCLPPLNSGPRDNPADFPEQLEVWAYIKTGYHYTTETGVVVRDYAPLLQTQQAAEWAPDDIVAFFVEWNGTWQVTRPPQDNTMLPCRAGDEDFSPGGRADIPGVYMVTGTRPAPNPTDGCLVVVRLKLTETSFGPPILFLDRFGVLLAVGAAAHQLRPELPVASQRDTDEANAIAAQGPLP